MQTPLSDDPAEDCAEDEDCAAFSELLEDSATFSEEELVTTFAELDDAAELDSATEELDAATELKATEDDDSSPTAAGELSESPHATNVNGKANEPASITVNNQLERDLLLIKNAILLSCPRILSLRSRTTGHLLFLNIYQKTRNIKLRVS